MRLRLRMPRAGRSGRPVGTSGAAAVELALTAPVLMTLLLGGIDFGLLFNNGQSITAATRVGVQYARNSSVCQDSATGIQMLPTVQIGATCITNIQQAMQDSRNFVPALTFPSGVSLECRCDADGSLCDDQNSPPVLMPANYSCPSNGRGANQIFVRVTARQTLAAPLFPWPGYPTVLDGRSVLQIQ